MDQVTQGGCTGAGLGFFPRLDWTSELTLL